MSGPATAEPVNNRFTSYDEITAGFPAPHHALRHIWPLSLFPSPEMLPEHRTSCQQKWGPVQQTGAITVLTTNGSDFLTDRRSDFSSHLPVPVLCAYSICMNSQPTRRVRAWFQRRVLHSGRFTNIRNGQVTGSVNCHDFNA